jgi:hypothetical protein
MRLVGWPLAQTGARLLVHSGTVEFTHIRKFLASSIAGRNAEGNGTFPGTGIGKLGFETRKANREERI